MAFCAITFITSLTTVTPQLMLPLVGELAPANRRATALSVVVSCLLFGLLVARVLSGIITEYVGWRAVYFLALGLQCLVLALLYLFMPDYPSLNPGVNVPRKYPGLLFDILRIPTRSPVLVQACLVGFFASGTFTSFWTTLTFLLAGDPYNYSSLVIGLFALIGIASMCFPPLFARTVMDNMVPLFSTIFGEIVCLVGVVIGTYTGLHTVAGPIIQAACVDSGIQVSQIGNRTAIYTAAPKCRNRVNTAYMVAAFCGQITGTAVGNRLYARGGWTYSGSASVGFICAALFFSLVRGPHEQGWFGWRGGAEMRASHAVANPKQDEECGAQANNKEPTPTRAGKSEEPGNGGEK